MSKFQQIAQQLQQQINAGIWQSGDKLPSLRHQAEQQQVSLMTVMNAYALLESQGWIISRPQSGYYVAPQVSDGAAAVVQSEQTETNRFVFDVLQASRDPQVVPFGSAFPDPDPDLFPLQQLMRSLTSVSRRLSAGDAVDNLPPGNVDLRKVLARRYTRQGIIVSPDDIVITNGAMDALNLSLQAVTEPGDWVIIESPAFYGALQAIERLRLKALAIPALPGEGIDLQKLQQALKRWPIKACWLMTNCQNPLGYTLTAERKQQLVRLLEQNQVALIEDDVYTNLWQGEQAPLPALAWDRQGTVLHCGSFSKDLAAGFRIGWVVSRGHGIRIQQLQLMSTLSVSTPIQLALADFLQSQHYDLHLKRLRRQLAQRKKLAVEALKRALPAQAKIYADNGGYFLGSSHLSVN
ncbi:PLP-dependent aminotransferase family protein [Tatumella sp. JGM130]|uniref:aminotransferase-like domain-containing protein n=1 Tax=Tatumella sp. JGM130 TaxID=2799797 RepID=UPI001BAF78E4|nr:PLP-dependent aminotransferase family protein [Tatumella sp. JGM130]